MIGNGQGNDLPTVIPESMTIAQKADLEENIHLRRRKESEQNIHQDIKVRLMSNEMVKKTIEPKFCIGAKDANKVKRHTTNTRNTHLVKARCHKKHQSPSSKSKGENETNNNGRTKATLTSFHNPEKIQEVCDQSSDSDESIDSLDAAFSTQSTDKKVLDLDALGAKSEKRIRKHNLVPLPDSDSFYFERQKERYYANMHKLIVTARSQIQSLEQKIEVLNKRQESHSTLKCPQCKHQFSTGQNRLLPKYVRVLQSTNRVELQFENMDSIKNWLIAYDLDRDAKGIPCFISETKPKGELTLADVKSTLMNVKLQKEAY
ncbi:hypothetical protein DdX_06464 [Ditylenchus destructor]|uniref:Uncharacterized protein n=1 Tax=Ditylenchus destructor TaxID=166010 RepID=A0AAD4N7N2_9BILA|nr:hypothetical protein DdX_06464 [Ditylenchus destructor]